MKLASASGYHDLIDAATDQLAGKQEDLSLAAPPFASQREMDDPRERIGHCFSESGNRGQRGS